MSAVLERASKHLADRGLTGDWAALPSRYEEPGFQTLCRIMAFQQLSGAVALRMCEAVEAQHGGRFPTADELASTSSQRAFVRAGVAPFRVRFIVDMAASLRKGEVSIPSQSAPDVEEQLRAIRGVGPWTSDMYRMFALRELDVWPIGDVGLRKGLAIHSGSKEGDGNEWGPYRSLATWFLWQKVPNFPLPGFRAPTSAPRQSRFSSVSKDVIVPSPSRATWG